MPDYVPDVVLAAFLEAVGSGDTSAYDPYPVYTTAGELAAALSDYVPTGSGDIAWSAISDKPSTFPPSAHTTSLITDFTSAVNSLIANVIAGAPDALNTLDELAAALNDDPAFATTITNLINAKAADSAVVKLTTNQTVAGTKTFTSPPVVPDSSFTVAKTTGLQTALDAKADDSAVVKLAGTQTMTGTKTFSTPPAVPDSSFTTAKTTGLQSTLDTISPLLTTLGVRSRTGVNAWPARPPHVTVMSIGPDPSPTDQVSGDLRSIPAS